MKRFPSLASLMVFGLLVWMAQAVTPAFANGQRGGATPPGQQTTQPQSPNAPGTLPESQQQINQEEQQQQQQQQAPPQLFSGKIQKQGRRYVFTDSANQTTYKLNKQRTVKKYDGQNVKIEGTLDSSSQTIHVKKIQPAS